MFVQIRRNEKILGGGYQLFNIIGHHGWPMKNHHKQEFIKILSRASF